MTSVRPRRSVVQVDRHPCFFDERIVQGALAIADSIAGRVKVEKGLGNWGSASSTDQCGMASLQPASNRRAAFLLLYSSSMTTVPHTLLPQP